MLDALRERVQEYRSGAGSDSGGDLPESLNERNHGISQTENAVAFAAAIAATFLARNALQLCWRKTLDREPPKNPASYDVAWKEALLWGAVSGAIVGVARIASRRASSSAYHSIKS